MDFNNKNSSVQHNQISFCSYCKKDTTGILHLICASVECKHEALDGNNVIPDSSFQLCGDCFSAGVNYFPHQNHHPYRVVDCLDVPIFVPDWNASDELMLLEGKLIDDFNSLCLHKHAYLDEK